MDGAAVALNVVPVVENASLEDGETLNVDIYVSGTGRPDYAKLHVQHPYPRAIEEVTVQYAVDVEEGTGRVVAGDEGAYEINEAATSTVGYTAILSPAYFAQVRRDGRTLDQIYGEKKHDGHPPIDLSIDIAPDAPPGDYELVCTLTYSRDGVVTQSVERVDFHIQNIYEANIELIAIAIISSLLLVANTLANWIDTALLFSIDSFVAAAVSAILLVMLYLQSTVSR